jgi:hypothetical protein
MCMNCGCGQVEERHGSEANIVAEDIRRAAAANRQDLGETVHNLEASLRRVGSGGFAASGAGGGSNPGMTQGAQGTPRR